MGSMDLAHPDIPATPDMMVREHWTRPIPPC